MTMQKKRKSETVSLSRLDLAQARFEHRRQGFCDAATLSYQQEGRGAVAVILWEDGDPDDLHYIPRAGIQELLARMGVEDTARVLELIDHYQPGQEFVAFIIHPVETTDGGYVDTRAAILKRKAGQSGKVQ